MKRFPFLAPLALAGMLVACSDSGPETTRLSILLTDAPGDVLEAVVTISSIYLQGDENENDPSGQVILMDEPVTADLLTLTNDFQTLVDEAVVTSGEWGQLRFVIDGAYIVVETDTGQEVYATPDFAEAPPQVDGVLLCPSCSQSGFKVIFPGALTLVGDEETWAVDFEVAESFGQQAGASGMWVMNPTLKSVPPPAANEN